MEFEGKAFIQSVLKDFRENGSRFSNLISLIRTRGDSPRSTPLRK